METFKAYRAFDRFDALLTRIAVNHCIDYLRQKSDFVALELEPAAEIVQTAASTVVGTQTDTLPKTKETISRPKSFPRCELLVRNSHWF